MSTTIDFDNTKCEDNPADKQVYQSLAGSLMYAALGTRPDISYSVTVLSRYSSMPLQMHLKAAKQVLRYLKRTKHPKLRYPPTKSELIGYTDSDWTGRTKDRKSIGGCIFFKGGPISWRSRTQTVVALSTLAPMSSTIDFDNTKCEDKLIDKRLYQSLVGSLMYAAPGTRPDTAVDIRRWLLGTFQSSLGPLWTVAVLAIIDLFYQVFHGCDGVWAILSGSSVERDLSWLAFALCICHSIGLVIFWWITAFDESANSKELARTIASLRQDIDHAQQMALHFYLLHTPEARAELARLRQS